MHAGLRRQLVRHRRRHQRAARHAQHGQHHAQLLPADAARRHYGCQRGVADQRLCADHVRAHRRLVVLRLRPRPVQPDRAAHVVGALASPLLRGRIRAHLLHAGQGPTRGAGSHDWRCSPTRRFTVGPAAGRWRAPRLGLRVAARPAVGPRARPVGRHPPGARLFAAREAGRLVVAAQGAHGRAAGLRRRRRRVGARAAPRG
mmetsp:Transcript_24004/g.77471  ORF Transcript_24004/g.77471 Transcript_24004/m.77471 type:complete len:202 (+) Transcript_24004:7389-7994(+)